MIEPRKILIVDDNDAGRYVKKHILERAGYSIGEAREGFEALRALVASKPDLVLLDVSLPDISGIELCRKLRENQVNVAVLMTSAAFIDPAGRIAALESGADSYLIEPIDPNELVASVRALLRMGKAEQELRALNAALARKFADRTRELAEVTDTLATERQNAALAQEALWHSQRLEAIGQLTGGIAHDFNNLLTVVLGNLEIMEQLLRREAPLDKVAPDKLLRHTRSSRRAASDCATIVRQLLVFARRDGLRQQNVDVGQAIARLEDFIRRSVGEPIGLDLSVDRDATPCKIDPAHLEAALLNLAINARDAMPRGGKLTIAIRNVRVANGTVDLPGTPVPGDILPGDYVAVTVSDTGSGMEKDVAARAFEPFFTTKDIGKGSGLGLSQVFGFVKQSNGYVAVESAPGKGARFGLFLPRSTEGLAHPAQRLSVAADLPHGKGTVLVVEDNALVLDYVAAMTADLGYRVLRATTGDEALAVIRQGEAIDLLFTDVVMPNGMSGIDLALEVRRLRPEVKVLITSGYPGRALADKRGAEFMSLVKPYSAADLANRLREALAN